VSLSATRSAALEATATRARQHCIELSARGGCFLGAALSCVDLLVFLYSEVLCITPDSHASLDRDYFLLSKGHAAPALYAALVEHGFFAKTRLASHLSTDDVVYWHPNPTLPGVEFHSGSLGHLLSVGMGIALDARLAARKSRVFVLLGDGELDEGSIWEALLVASAHKLDNLVVIVDRNRIQANAETEQLVPLEPLADKFKAFGAVVANVDGHAFTALDALFSALPLGEQKPLVVIANTLRGKGLASHEQRVDRWFVQGDASALGAELVAEPFRRDEP
jgi:transketolase